jgi:hypothetical protein
MSFFDEKEEKVIENINFDENSKKIESASKSRLIIDEDFLETQKKLWDSYLKIDQPNNLKIKLFPHQLVSVYNMELLEKTRKIKVYDSIYLTDFGILGDIPGYGKSFSVVSLVLRDSMHWDISQMHEKSDIRTINQCLKIVSKYSKRRVRANLLLCSSTLVEQWKEYFSFVKPGSLKIKEICNRKDIEDNFDPNDWDIIIVSSVRYNELVDLFPNVVWKRFIFDEASSTHINSMRHINAGFTWFISATYRDLNKCGGTSGHYMKSFFSKIDYGILNYFVIKNPESFVKHSFKMPEVVNINHVCLNPRILNVLSNFIDSETQTMIAAGDIKSAILRLGGGTAVGSNLFEIVSKKQQEKLTQAKFSLDMWKSRQDKGLIVSSEILFWEKRISELEKTIQELKVKYEKLFEEDCSICFLTIEDPILIPCCQNVFCGKCIMKWMETNKSCPMCRSSINVKELVYIKKDKNDKDEEKEQKIVNIPKKDVKVSKQDKVLELVKTGINQNKKFLIFSMYDESFQIIRRVLDDHNIDFVEISGTKAARDSKIKKFKENKINVVFLNSRFNGAGINLEMATDIILYHDMPSGIKEQVIGRALRIGREDSLTIHNLIF